MRLGNFKFLALTAALFWPVGLLAAANDYSACANLNDFLSYSKCVAEIDSRQSGQTTVLVDDVKDKEGEFSLAIGDGSGTTHSPDVTLFLTASATTTAVSIAKDSNFGFAGRLDFSAKKLWRLEDAPDTTQYVYVKFFDKDGQALSMVSAPIIYSPRQAKPEAVAAAKTAFAQIYKRSFAAGTAFDSGWLDIAVYGVPANAPRDLSKEQSALAAFSAAYKHLPQSDSDWLLVKAMAYTPVAATNTAAVTVAATDNNCVAQPITKVLDVGSQGADVKNVQTLLRCGGYLDKSAPVDGNFDKTVEAAVSKFQAEYKLSCVGGVYCGRVGPATAKKLAEVYAPSQTAVAGVKVGDAVIAAALKLSRDLTVGSQGNDVTALQQYLAGDHNLYPEAKVTGLFGPLTEAAVKRFQSKYGLACHDGSYCGYVGPATRQKLQEVSAK